LLGGHREDTLPRINWKTVIGDIAEAREELQNIEKMIDSGHSPTLEDFQTRLEHVYHHLNVAWNARYISTKHYSEMTQEAYDLWSQHPTDIFQHEST
jgi:hypothetical protein